jgi:MFS transporter, FHS family, glucose/mannose:H+ symporter
VCTSVKLHCVTKTTTAAGFLAFFLLGAVQAFYGPAQFALATRFDIAPSATSLIVSAHFLGSMTGILALSSLSRMLGWRTVLVLGSGLLVLGCAGVALALVWWMALLGALLIGLGFGFLDISFNILFSSGFGEKSTAMTNVLNAPFGVGAIVGPFVVSAFVGDSRTPFWLVAAATLLLVPLVLGMRVKTASESSGKLVFSSLFAMFVLMFFVYVGVEVSAATLEPRHLKDGLGYSEQSSAQWNALYWAGLTASRLLIAPIALRVTASNIVLGSVFLALLGLGLTFVPALAPYGYVLAGLGFGPIFPTGFVWLTSSLPNAVAAGSVVVAAANFGAVLLPPLGSSLAMQSNQIPFVLLVQGVVLLGVALLLRRLVR